MVFFSHFFPLFSSILNMNIKGSLLWAIVFCVVFEKTKAGPKLIVVLVDGVRWDYLDDPKLKGFRRIAETGVKAPYVVPIFPSLSYPNWYTIVTGLYAENHGFVDNYLYDNATDTFYVLSSDPNGTDPMWWNDAEPIWITAEKNHKPAAMYWWGGCEARIRRYHPTICERERYGPPTPEEKQDFLQRIDDIIQMFKPSKRFPKDRLSLALMYYGPTDYNGHHHGPNSKEMNETMHDIDSILDSMLDKLQKAGLKDEVNVMVVSDHGMTEMKNVKHVDLERFSSLIKYQVSSGVQSMIVPEEGMLDKLYRELKQANINGIEVYKKEDIPEKYHIKESKRTTPIFLIAHKGFLIKKLSDPNKSVGGDQGSYKGAHGYDPATLKDMGAIFLATGPDIQRNSKLEALNMTDLYNVMCSVLKMQPLPNNGSVDRVKSIVKPSYDASFIPFQSSAPIHVYCFSIMVSSILCLLISNMHLKTL